jgi:RecJ-like exonuclease
MARKTPKSQVVAFKVEEDLADFLNKLPNKSAFIRKSIVAQLGMTCPLCTGSGVVPKGVHDHYAPVLAKNNVHKCDVCGDRLTLPRDLVHLDDKQRARMEQFFHGGPLYCEACYLKQPACDDCGMHIEPALFSEHYKKAHAN